MPENEVFFSDQTEQSATKAHIVSSYFTAWSRVIKNGAQRWRILIFSVGQNDMETITHLHHFKLYRAHWQIPCSQRI